MAHTLYVRYHSGDPSVPHRGRARIARRRAERLYRASIALMPPPLPRLPIVTQAEVRRATRIEVGKRRRDRMRRAAQAGLRSLGFVRETTTASGSSYYVGAFAPRFERVLVRVSDHAVPMTPERESLSFTWARDGFEIITAPETSTMRKVRAALAALAREIHTSGSSDLRENGSFPEIFAFSS